MEQESEKVLIPFESLVKFIEKLDLREKIRLWELLDKQISQIDEGDEKSERHIWYALGTKSLERVWDNDADAVYDNWRDMYNVPKR